MHQCYIANVYLVHMHPSAGSKPDNSQQMDAYKFIWVGLADKCMSVIVL